MSYKKKLKANIWKYYVFHFLDMFAFFTPFLVYYLQRQGFSLTNIMIMNAFFAMTLFMFEIPSGYVADRIGRKNSLIISIVFQMLSMLILYLSTNYFLLVLSFVCSGIGIAFLSGADSALLYDSLLGLKKEHLFKKYEGRAKFFSEIAVILASLAGAFIVLYDLLLPILFTLIGHGVLLLFTFTMTEPHRHKKIEQVPFRKELYRMLEIIIYALKDRRLLGLFLYSFFVLGVSNTIFKFYQPYFAEVNISVPFFGVLFALFSLSTAFAAFNADWLERKLGVFGSLLIMPILLIITLLGVGYFFVWWAVLFFLFREFVRGFLFPVLGDYTNKLVSSEKRATVLSIGSMFSRLGLTIISVTLAWFADINLRSSLIGLGIFLALIVVVVLLLMRNGKN